MYRFIAIVFGLFLSTSVLAQPVKMTAIGDSLTDEYLEWFYSGAGASSAAWTEILVNTGRADFGLTAAQAGFVTWNEPRNAGFQHNWARYSFDSAGAALYESPGCVTSIQAGQEIVLIYIGGNDFNPAWETYNHVYNGEWTGAQIDSAVATTIGNIRNCVEDLQVANAKIVLATPMDFGAMGFLRNGHPSASQREQAAELTHRCRDGLRALALEKHIVFLDMWRLNRDLFGDGYMIQNGVRNIVYVGGVPIHMQEGGITGDKGFIFDGIHPQRVVQAIWAEAFVTATNVGFNKTIPHFTESEMVTIGGLTYGGSDTLSQVMHPMPFYVQNFGCIADYNSNGVTETQDIFAFLNDWFANDIKASMSGSSVLTTQDIFTFLNTWFNGC